MENGAGGKEQQALKEGVVHGVVQARGHAQARGQTHRSEHIADLGDGVEGQQTLEVMLGQGHGDAHEHTHRAQEHQPELHGAQLHGLEQEVGQTDQAVNAGLGQHAGDEHRDAGRGRAVGVRRQGMEGHDEGLGGEADEQQGEGQLGGGAQVAGDQSAQLGEVQGSGLGIEHDGARQDAGGADAAHHQVLESRLQRAGDGVAEGRQGHRREGQDLHHDEHVEEVAGEDHAQHAAGQHQEQGVILGFVVILAHVREGVEAGDEHGGGDQQPEEQAQGVHLQGDADGVAAGGDAAAHPVGDDAAVQEDGLHQQDQQGQ